MRALAVAGLTIALSGCATSTALPGTGTADVTRAPSGDIAALVDATLTGETGYDRLVLTFSDHIPGYTVGYRPLPARADASGFEIPLPGAADLVMVTLNPASAGGWAGGQQTYFGPSTLSGDTAVVTEVKAAGDFEATLSWAVGMRDKAPFRVLELDSPPRLEIDFQR